MHNYDTDTLPNAESHLRERHTQRYSPELARNDHQLDFDLPAQRADTEDSILDRSIDDAPRATMEILHGDAFQLIERLADDSVDLIITSPPYWGRRPARRPRHGNGIATMAASSVWNPYPSGTYPTSSHSSTERLPSSNVTAVSGSTSATPILQDGRAFGIKDDRGSATIGAAGEERRWEDTFRRNSFC